MHVKIASRIITSNVQWNVRASPNGRILLHVNSGKRLLATRAAGSIIHWRMDLDVTQVGVASILVVRQNGNLNHERTHGTGCGRVRLRRRGLVQMNDDPARRFV